MLVITDTGSVFAIFCFVLLFTVSASLAGGGSLLCASSVSLQAGAVSPQEAWCSCPPGHQGTRAPRLFYINFSAYNAHHIARVEVCLAHGSSMYRLIRLLVLP